MTLGPIAAVRVFVSDVAAARGFYRDMLGLEESYADDGVLVFRTGSADLVVEAADPDDAEEAAMIGRFVGVSFAVTDVRAVHAALAAKGVPFDGAPEVQPWGGVLAHLRDPAGNVLTLVQLPDDAA
ncbi:MAG: VOC family protein [Alphaproteobacteria bacterium]|nr:VOC family protein [Alphaproteobacteria bacterium]